MAYVAPQGIIKLLHGCPLNNRYEHTLCYPNATAQHTYFETLVKRSFTAESYTRLNRGILRVGVCADDVYDCNYLMYQNETFGSKWFYAFITSIEYINNVTTEIHFEIDVMQTWWYDFTILPCFVEREHILNDAYGANYVPEPLKIGEYVFNDYAPLTPLSALRVVVEVVDVSSQTVEGTLIDGIYSGAKLSIFDTTQEGITNLDAYIGQYRDRPDAILSMYMIPAILCSNIASGQTVTYSTQGGTNLTVSDTALTSFTTVGGHTVRNRKLFTYPYNFYHVDNASGNALCLRYEFFDNYQPQFTISGGIAPPISVICRPRNYKGVRNANSVYASLKNETLTINNFPLCSWNTDAYQAWLAQNTIPLMIGAFTGAVNTEIASTYARNPEGMRASGLMGIIGNAMIQDYKASIAADICKGQLNNGSTNCIIGTNQFYGGRMSISDKEASIIDDFFDMYGYQTNQIKYPNIGYRAHWNYVKTNNANIDGLVGAEDEKKICNILDNGITFWRNGSEVGNYRLDNRAWV